MTDPNIRLSFTHSQLEKLLEEHAERLFPNYIAKAVIQVGMETSGHGMCEVEVPVIREIEVVLTSRP